VRVLETARVGSDLDSSPKPGRMSDQADRSPDASAKGSCSCRGHGRQWYFRPVSVLTSIARRAGNSARRIAVHVPLLTAKELVYDRKYYLAIDAVHRPLYRLLADAVVELVEPKTAVDVGCGTGLVLTRLKERGVEVTGIEGSRHAIELSGLGDRVVKANLERELPRLGSFDVCFCIEVAEHLPGRSASPLVEGLTDLSDVVVFTAAPPGQGGSHHVNEQPPSYWEERFGARGFARDAESEGVLKGRIAEIQEPAWMHQNLMLFRRR
jgi:SAM-dependent methyltransferase